MTKSRRASDQRREKHRAFNGYLDLTQGSLALAATEESKLTVSLYSQGMGVRGMGILPKKKEPPAPTPTPEPTRRELEVDWHPLWRNPATVKILRMYDRPKPIERQAIIEANFGALNRFAIAA
jgi:hypothetical protein